MSHLTQEQRYTIAVLKTENRSQRYIAEQIKKDKSVVSRELRRNYDKRLGEYKAELANRKCIERHRLKPKRIHFTATIQ